MTLASESTIPAIMVQTSGVVSLSFSGGILDILFLGQSFFLVPSSASPDRSLACLRAPVQEGGDAAVLSRRP